MKFNIFFKIALVLALICEVGSAFAMKRKRDTEIEHATKKHQSKFNCPLQGQSCKSKNWAGLISTTDITCNNNRGFGFSRQQTLNSHIIQFHHACPICTPQVINQCKISFDDIKELEAHLKAWHRLESLRCKHCNEYITLPCQISAFKQHTSNCSEINCNQKNDNSQEVLFDKEITIEQENNNNNANNNNNNNDNNEQISTILNDRIIQEILAMIENDNACWLDSFSDNDNNTIDIQSQNNNITSIPAPQNSFVQQNVFNNCNFYFTNLPQYNQQMLQTNSFQGFIQDNQDNVTPYLNNASVQLNLPIRMNRTVGLNSEKTPCLYKKNDQGFYDCPYISECNEGKPKVKTPKALHFHILQRHRRCPFCLCSQTQLSVEELVEHCLKEHNITLKNNYCETCMNYIAQSFVHHKQTCQKKD